MPKYDRPRPRRRRGVFDDDDVAFPVAHDGSTSAARDDEAPFGFDDEPTFTKRGTRDPRSLISTVEAELARPLEGDRWSTWDDGVRGPEPYPDWLVTGLAAVDTELGVLKTGKEADVHLVRRGVPDGGPSCLLAAKRYRGAQHRMFHRDAGYLEGRRVRRSRETRAMANRTTFGRDVLAGQWAAAEFSALCTLWQLGVDHGLEPIVPYPVQHLGTEVLLEFIGDADEGVAAPRLAALRPDPGRVRDLWRQLFDALLLLVRAGYAHGDLSAYNILVHDGRLILIDLPQIVDLVANPQGPAFLARDVRNVAAWFVSRGMADLDAESVIDALYVEAGVR